MESSLNQATQQLGYKMEQPIGVFFTPTEWAEWAVTKFGILKSWFDGATICDPTAGTGNFLEALIRLALKYKGHISKEMIERLHGVEKEEIFVKDFYNRIYSRFRISFPEKNFVVGDILFLKRVLKTDILVGNPPWQNFTDLPNEYKEKIKPLFYKYGLVYDSQKLLLGSSRIDIAALVIAKTIQDDLKKSGSAFYFMPLSILLNEGAHKGFRSYKLNSTMFAIKEVYDFKNYSIFDSISTRYGFVHFKRDEPQIFPVPFVQYREGKWIFKKALPIINKDDPWTIIESDSQAKRFLNLRKISVPEDFKPRQGINTCGAHDVFIFDKVEPYRNDLYLAINSIREETILPKQFLHPLITKDNFAQEPPIPRRFILLPYDKENGKPLLEKELQSHPELWEYLISKKHRLQKRKGLLINTWIRKGIWWALLGVGSYSFAPVKIVWEAYGKAQFNPKIFKKGSFGIWQGNQAMHAYIPVSSIQDAQNILSELRAEEIQNYLMSFQMEGTCNWAQPGRMKKIFSFNPKRLGDIGKDKVRGYENRKVGAQLRLLEPKGEYLRNKRAK